MEWVTGMLNSPLYIKADCTPDAASEVSFREKYLLTKLNAVPSSTTIEPAANAFPACKITPATNAVTCGCPAANAGTPDLDATERPSFSVGFEKINPPPGSTPAVIDSYAQLVKVTVWACSARAGTCTRDNFASAEGNARITTTLKVRPLLRAVPAAPLTCGRSCNLGGSSNIVNRDVATNGILINAGNAINSGGANITLATLPGQPAQNAQISNDASLAALSGDDAQCNKSKMFNAYFGSTYCRLKCFLRGKLE